MVMNENDNDIQNRSYTEETPTLIRRKELMNLPGIRENPISAHIIRKYTVGTKVAINKLASDLNKLFQNDNGDFKVKFLFDIYDTDGDGVISSVELFDLLKILNKGRIEDYKLQNIVDQTFAEIGEYTTFMNFEQFKFLLEKSDSSIAKLLFR